MGNNQRKKLEAKRHNEMYEKKKAIEKDKLENPEKYKRRTNRKARLATFIGVASALAATR